MRIAFIGKGGSGKSTMTSLFSSWLIQTKNIKNILLIDGDHNVHLAQMLARKTITVNLFNYGDYVKNWTHEIRTSLPKTNGEILSFSTIIHGINLIEVGELEAHRVGSRCYHGQIGDVEVFLNHLIDTENEWIVSDMTAGTDILGSSYFSKFDLLVGVVEPTHESVKVIQEIAEKISEYEIPLMIIGNKIHDNEDRDFIKNSLNPIGNIYYAKMRSESVNLEGMEETFSAIYLKANELGKNWERYERNLEKLHNKNLDSWAKDIEGHGTFSYREVV